MRRVERTFARRMRELRQARGLSQAKLAAQMRRLGLTLDPSAVTRIEKNADTDEGARAIYLGEAVVVARALGVRLDEMIREVKTPYDKLLQARQRLVRAQEALDVFQFRIDEARREYVEARDEIDGIEKSILAQGFDTTGSNWRQLILNALQRLGAPSHVMDSVENDLAILQLDQDQKVIERLRKQLEPLGVEVSIVEGQPVITWPEQLRAVLHATDDTRPYPVTRRAILDALTKSAAHPSELEQAAEYFDTAVTCAADDPAHGKASQKLLDLLDKRGIPADAVFPPGFTAIERKGDHGIH